MNFSFICEEVRIDTMRTMNDTIKEARVLCANIRFGISALDAVNTAMGEGPFPADDFIDALYCVLSFLDGKQKELEALLNEYSRG